MQPIAKTLALFNRKERYWLLRNAIGERFETLDEAFRQRLDSAIKKALGREIPPDAWWAMDYHLNWLVASVYCYYENLLPQVGRIIPLDQIGDHRIADNKDLLKASQEDVDLIIAFDEIIILIEAKVDSSWSNQQFISKQKRTNALRKFNSALAGNLSASGKSELKIISVFASPDSEHKEKLPKEHHFLPLNYKSEELVRIGRCRKDGTPDEKGGHWAFALADAATYPT